MVGPRSMADVISSKDKSEDVTPSTAATLNLSFGSMPLEPLEYPSIWASFFSSSLVLK